MWIESTRRRAHWHAHDTSNYYNNNNNQCLDSMCFYGVQYDASIDFLCCTTQTQIEHNDFNQCPYWTHTAVTPALILLGNAITQYLSYDHRSSSLSCSWHFHQLKLIEKKHQKHSGFNAYMPSTGLHTTRRMLQELIIQTTANPQPCKQGSDFPWNQEPDIILWSNAFKTGSEALPSISIAITPSPACS